MKCWQHCIVEEFIRTAIIMLKIIIIRLSDDKDCDTISEGFFRANSQNVILEEIPCLIIQIKNLILSPTKINKNFKKSFVD